MEMAEIVMVVCQLLGGTGVMEPVWGKIQIGGFEVWKCASHLQDLDHFLFSAFRPPKIIPFDPDRSCTNKEPVISLLLPTDEKP